MSAPKPLLVLLVPVVLAVPFVVSTGAQAQERTATNAILTTPAKPSTSIAPRQSLPTFTLAKALVSPMLALPADRQPITPPVPVSRLASATTPAMKPIKEAALPTNLARQVSGTLSAREVSALATPSPVAATPRVRSQRRAFAAEVSLSTSPVKTTESTIQLTKPIAPAASLAPVKVIVPLPRVEVKVAPVAGPSVLSSREARARDITLARLDAQLAGAEVRLDRAQSRLTEGQRQLGSVNQLLQNAILTSGGSGLHPFVRVAQRYLGTPYVWGGESARGFDCSGFIMRVMRDLGYKALPHSAAEQFNYGKPVSKGLLQPGDIVFFANTYKPGISHVGIYLGGGRFIHAANSQVGTIVSNLNSSKWAAKYAGARRLIKAS